MLSDRPSAACLARTGSWPGDMPASRAPARSGAASPCRL